MRDPSWFLAFCVALLGCVAAGCRQQTLRVMTWNIHHAEGTDGKIDLLRVSDTIRRENPDLVILQEVDRGTIRASGRDLVEELSALTKMNSVFGKNLDYQGGVYGNAVLSRFPIVYKDNHVLPGAEKGEQRGALEARLRVGKHQFLVVATHLDHHPDPSVRLAQIARVQEIVKKASLPAIVCGDLNSQPGSGEWKQMKGNFQDAWEKAGKGEGYTIASGKPYARIDYIFVSREIKPVRAWVVPSEASDHLPVVADLQY